MRLAVAFSLLASLALCGTALGATTVRVEDRNVLITDESGERNSITISVVGPVVTVSDTAASLAPRKGCTAQADDGVRCRVANLKRVRAHLGDGPDSAFTSSDAGGAPGCDCIALYGEGGYDTLSGGVDDDRLVGGRGRDGLAGGPGDDVLRGNAGRDELFGGAPGNDRLDGGSGGDQLDDNDGRRSVGRDTVIGGPDVDEVFSYFARSAPVLIDLRGRSRNDGQRRERDMLVNVEIVEGGDGDDRLIGDGDGNGLYGGRGTDRIDGRGGRDGLFEFDDNPNQLNGGGAGDRITAGRAGGGVSCGRGNDTVSQARPGRDDPALGDGLRGPLIAPNCEAIAEEGFGIDPVPDEPVSGRLITLERPAGFRADPDFFLALSDVDEPFTEFGRENSTREGITIRLPRDVAESARRDGRQFRAEVARPDNSRRYLVWRFLQKPAR